jgi:hypothetical protein
LQRAKGTEISAVDITEKHNHHRDDCYKEKSAAGYLPGKVAGEERHYLLGGILEIELNPKQD